MLFFTLCCIPIQYTHVLTLYYGIFVAAIIHYKPDNITNAKIGKEGFFLLDTGGQYLDGTTDVSRTFHFGTASDFEREVYTRVLMGSIDLARATFLDGTPDTRLDILARWNLYKVGLNYRHGTGKKLQIFSINMITTYKLC